MMNVKALTIDNAYHHIFIHHKDAWTMVCQFPGVVALDSHTTWIPTL